MLKAINIEDSDYAEVKVGNVYKMNVQMAGSTNPNELKNMDAHTLLKEPVGLPVGPAYIPTPISGHIYWFDEFVVLDIQPGYITNEYWVRVAVLKPDKFMEIGWLSTNSEMTSAYWMTVLER